MAAFGDADLVITPDVGYSRTIVYKINNVAIDWTLYTVQSQARDLDGTLKFDFTPFLQVLSTDSTVLVMMIPPSIVNSVPHETKWDLVAALKSDSTMRFRTPQPVGRVLVLPRVTRYV
jgi:hypothetical protein